MDSRKFYCLILCLFFLNPVFAFILITEEEANKEAQVSQDYVVELSQQNSLPVIKLINPELLSVAIKSPISIELQFIKKDVPIDPKTFQALYGSFKLDVTKRILEEAEIDQQFLKVKNAKLPKGKHLFLVQVADKKGRVAKKIFKIRVQ